MKRTAWLLLLLFLGGSALADETTRSVTVNGVGSATAEADRATVRMSVVARDPDLATAQAAASEVTASILELTDRLGIDRDEVDTTGATVRPDYHWDRESNQQVLRGYVAERQMRVDLEDLDKLGQLTEGSVDAGVNQVMPPQLDSSERRDAYRRALRAAADDARANARELSEALGAELGEVISVNAGKPLWPPGPEPNYAAVRTAGAADMEAAETYDPGQLEFTANITVVFALRD